MISAEKKKKSPPGPPRYKDAFLPISRDPIPYTLNLWKEYGDIIRIHFLLRPATVLNRPEYARHILQENYKNYDKDIALIRGNSALLGNGLFTNTEEQSWKIQRKLIQPIFQKQSITTYLPSITQATSELTKKFEAFADTGQVVDIPSAMLELTLRTFGLSFFSIDLEDEAKHLQSAFAKMLPRLADYLTFPFPPLTIPTLRNRKIVEAVRTIDKTVYRLIELHHQNSYHDALERLINARDDSGNPMDNQQIRDESVTLLMAGHDTTATMISYTLYALSQHPKVEQRLYEDLTKELAGNPLTIEQLSHLSYLTAVLQETLRLYPPSFALTRHAINEDEIDGYVIPRDSIIFINPYIIQRHPDIWEDPETFDPERFMLPHVASHPKLSFLPFGAGPHLCIGNSLAMLQASVAIAELVQRFTFHLTPPNHPVVPKLAVTMRPKYGLPMILKNRA